MFVALCNCPEGAAGTIARALVDEGLVACVNAIPVRSVYRWEGKVVEEAEITLVIKAPDANHQRMSARIKELHPHTVPEILVCRVDEGRSNAEYVAWVDGFARLF